MRAATICKGCVGAAVGTLESFLEIVSPARGHLNTIQGGFFEIGRVFKLAFKILLGRPK